MSTPRPQKRARTADVAGRRVDAWFASRGWRPFTFQREVWEAYQAGESGLVHAATGTGKTLSAWIGPLLEWLREADLSPAPAHPLDHAAARPRCRHRRGAAPALAGSGDPLDAGDADG